MSILNEIKNKLYGDGVEVPLTDDELISVCLTFPGALVAACDGNFDAAERLTMLDISESLGDGDAATDSDARLSAAERYRAFMWFLDNKSEVEDLIFDGIKQIISIDDNAGPNLVNMLYEIADVSDGLSEVELNEIGRICNILGIENKVN